MDAENVSGFAVKTNQQGTEFVQDALSFSFLKSLNQFIVNFVV